MVLEDVPVTQRERLAYLEMRVRFLGECRRQDLLDRFTIQEAAATRDFAAYRVLAPNNLEFDSSRKCYLLGAKFKPLFELPAERILTWLSQGFGDGIPVRQRGYVSSEPAPFISKPDLDALAAISRAIYKRALVRIRYCSLSSGKSERVIAPFALAGSGWRWHVRAFDRKSGEFHDFALTRITAARHLDELAHEEEGPERDIQWNRIVELELVPHPDNIRFPAAIESDLGMTDGCARTQVRAAMAGYLLRLWNVDASPDHHMRGPEYQLWLRNTPTLYGVQNLALAPGYLRPEEKEDQDGYV